MRIPAITGIIRRRILINYRVAPHVVQGLLPGHFRPKLFGGHAIAGICLIRLEQVRPKGLPALIGFSSENSAHRFAVEWQDAGGGVREGVFVPRRDTGSWVNSLAGGRIFPGVHHHSDFRVEDREGRISILVQARDMEPPLVEIAAREETDFPGDSVFESLAASSRFFEAGCVGYSARPGSCVLDGLLLKVPEWRVSPLAVSSVRSAYFDDRKLFPEGDIAFDHAMLMRDAAHEWHSEPPMTTQLLNP